MWRTGRKMMRAWAPTAAISFTKIIINKTGEFIDFKFKEEISSSVPFICVKV
jgi:hypothetical protein